VHLYLRPGSGARGRSTSAQSPGEYEPYVDLEPGAWTSIEVVVAGTKARLYVHGADQPASVVNDLKLGEARGQVALCAHWNTDSNFANPTISN
jgi:hypothetical protein